MAIAASSHKRGARGVRLTFTLHYWMQCEYPGAGPLVLTFPKAVKLPAQLASGAVQLAGKPVASQVDGRQVTVMVAPHTGILCDLMSRGSLRLAFTSLANLSNPTRAGSYRFAARHGQLALTATLTIKPAS